MLAISPPLAMVVGIYLGGVCKKRPVFKKVPITIGGIFIIVSLLMTGLILPALDTGAMRVFSLKIAAEIEKDDKIGMGSGQFNIKKLGIHLNNLVSDVNQVSADELAQYTFANKKFTLIPVLRAREKIFVLITKADYENYVPSGLREKIDILETHDVWNRKRLKKVDFELLQTILKRDFESLKEEAYLITNRR